MQQRDKRAPLAVWRRYFQIKNLARGLLVGDSRVVFSRLIADPMESKDQLLYFCALYAGVLP